MAEANDARHSDNDSIKKIADLIHGIDIAMLTTVNADGHLQSRPMGTQKMEFDGTLWFFTFDDSTKACNIRQNPQVNVAYSAPNKQDYVSLSGHAEVVKDRAKMEELWQPILKAWFPQELDTPGIALIKVQATSAEIWDAPSSTVAHVISLVKGVVTGKPADPGENFTVHLPDRELAGAGR